MMEFVKSKTNNIFQGVEYIKYDRDNSMFYDFLNLNNKSKNDSKQKSDVHQLQEKIESLIDQKKHREKVIDEHKKTIIELNKKIENLTQQKMNRDKIIEEHKFVQKELRDRLAKLEK